MFINKLNPVLQYKNFSERVKKLKGNPYSIAMGLSIGIFIGATPTIPFHSILALVLAVFLRASKVAALLGVWYANPFTIPILYFASYKVGVFLFGEKSLHEKIISKFLFKLEGGETSLFEKVKIAFHFIIEHLHLFNLMLLGGVVIGLCSAMPVYFLVYSFFKKKLEKKKNKKS